MKKLYLLFLLQACFYFSNSQSNLKDIETEIQVLRIDSLVNSIRIDKKPDLIDSGLIRLMPHKQYAYFCNFIWKDSLSGNLLAICHEMDTSDKRDFIIFYFNNDDLIKVEYSIKYKSGEPIPELSHDGYFTAVKANYYYHQGKCINSYFSGHGIVMNPLTSEQLYKKGIDFLINSKK